jgi:hypothetical protein
MLQRFLQNCFGKADCEKVRKNCHEQCAEKYVGRGYGSDAPLLYRKCMRECVKANGCHDY